ncbi:hypothetical protein HID58_086544 [Brassica napus]|uniref:Uncharacterized protein n=1 Tax=Brassica napus TaxID=3708 RepID=A0ABQ7XTB0_BRANA|nr:hypothetical protein HID58_086544 [Brassica napus]
MKYVVLLRKKILLGIQNRLPTIKRFPPRDQVMKQRVQIHHLPAMNSTTHRNVSLLLHSTTHCNVSLLLCFWEVRNSKKGGKFMGIDIVLVDEKPENHGKLKLGSYEGTMFLAEAIGASLLQSISDYISDFDIFMIGTSATNYGLSLYVFVSTKPSLFYMLITERLKPVHVEGLTSTVISSIAQLQWNMTCLVNLSHHICIDTLCPMWCITTAVFLEGFPRVQNPNQRFMNSQKRFQHMVDACGVNKSLKNVALKKVIT